MRGAVLAAMVVVVLSGCLSRMMSSPPRIATDGSVVCDDSMSVPRTALVAGLVSGSALAAALAKPEAALDNGGILWMPLLGELSIDLLFGAAESHGHVQQCRAAKQRAARTAEVARRKATARAEAGALWKRAAAAARADDCTTVREVDPQVRELDVEFHAVVFSRDVAIARCLAMRE